MSKSNEIYDMAVEKLNKLGGCYCDFNTDMIMLFGPAHIVWDDGNMTDDDIKFCIRRCYEHNGQPDPMPWEALDVVMWSLQELLKIPYEERVEDDN